MVTVLRAAGMRFVVYTDDHAPAHVYGEGEARIHILDLTVLSNRGMTKRDLSVALAIIQTNQRLFIEKWESIHG